LAALSSYHRRVELHHDYASAKGKPAVINLSYGGSAARDGVRRRVAIDQLSALPERIVVVSADNGFGAGCHITSSLASSSCGLPMERQVRGPDGGRSGLVNAQDAFAVSLTAPDGTARTFQAPVYAQSLRTRFPAHDRRVDRRFRQRSCRRSSSRGRRRTAASGFAPAPPANGR
jgi:hypothetical protein